MLARLGARLSAFFRATAPDPFVIAVLLTVVAGVVSAGWIWRSDPSAGPVAAVGRTLDDWQAGFWNLLSFGMQMCLILVTGHALAASPLVSRAIASLAGTTRSARGAIALTSVVAMLAALVNWGFGLIVGAILARDVMRNLARRGVRAPAGLVAAAGYAGLLVWHGGLSGSAPLKAASPRDQVEVLGESLASSVGAIPADQTLFGTLNLVTTLGLLVLVPVVLVTLTPKREADAAGCVDVSEAGGGAVAPAEREDPDAGALPRALERSSWVVWLVAAPALAWLAIQFWASGLSALNLNTANLLFLSLGLALHGSAHSYGRAVEAGARSCAGVIIQFPLYAGVMGMIGGSGLAVALSGFFVELSGGSEAGLSLTTFASAGVVNLFVPSGGGQWAIQGPIGMRAAMDTGADPARIVMAVSYGDQLTNMLQPFWALPLLAITGVRARDIVGYTAVLMVLAGVWIAGCLVLV